MKGDRKPEGGRLRCRTLCLSRWLRPVGSSSSAGYRPEVWSRVAKPECSEWYEPQLTRKGEALASCSEYQSSSRRSGRRSTLRCQRLDGIYCYVVADFCGKFWSFSEPWILKNFRVSVLLYCRSCCRCHCYRCHCCNGRHCCSRCRCRPVAAVRLYYRS